MLTRWILGLALVVSSSVSLSCGGGNAASDARFPPRPKGCEVRLYYDDQKLAGVKHDKIGGVDAICGSDLGREACLRELKDQTCKIGGDIVYDVAREPSQPAPDKIRFLGKVAHTRATQ